MKSALGMMAVVLVAGSFSVLAQSTEQKLAPGAVMVSLADARSRIDSAIETPAVMTTLMKQLSAEDQKQFLADVNKAIADMPASAEEKSAKFLNVNHAALMGAAQGNVATLIAEVYATVSPEALTIINERFAADLLNRSADADVTYTDEQYTRIALEVMGKVNERCEETDNGAPRSAFAILMLLRASNGSPANLSETLINTLKREEDRELARSEWIPSALGQDGRSQSYESLLASADAGHRPDLDFVLVIAGPQYPDSLLVDLVSKYSDSSMTMSTHSPILDAVENPLAHSIPNLGIALEDTATVRPQAGSNIIIVPDPWAKSGTKAIPNPPPVSPEPEPTPEPGPYQWQRI